MTRRWCNPKCGILWLGVVNAAIVSVEPGTNTLQAVIDGASDGDVLVLPNGTYTGTSDGDESMIRIAEKSITIRALHPRGAVLDAECFDAVVATDHCVKRVLSIDGGSVVLDGLDLTGGGFTSGSRRGAGAAVFSGTVTFNDCDFYSNHAGESQVAHELILATGGGALRRPAGGSLGVGDRM